MCEWVNVDMKSESLESGQKMRKELCIYHLFSGGLPQSGARLLLDGGQTGGF